MLARLICLVNIMTINVLREKKIAVEKNKILHRLTHHLISPPYGLRTAQQRFSFGFSVIPSSSVPVRAINRFLVTF